MKAYIEIRRLLDGKKEKNHFVKIMYAIFAPHRIASSGADSRYNPIPGEGC